MRTITTGVPDPDDGSEALRRFEEQCRRLGIRSPQCAWPGCAETNPFALQGYFPDISCYEHGLLRTGSRPTEDHHVAGRHNSHVTVEIPGNDHRIISELQRFWPEDTLRNPDHSPLLMAAAAIRGWLDVLRVIVERGVGWVPAFLEWLNQMLVGLFGSEWWRKLGWDGLR